MTAARAALSEPIKKRTLNGWIMRMGQGREGWYFNKDGRSVGPVSDQHLQELLAAGQIQPGQPVWRQDGLDRTFVRAEWVTQDGELDRPACACQRQTDEKRLNKETAMREQTISQEALQKTAEHYRSLAESFQAMNQQKDRFLAVLSHELRNPLAPILMALEVLRRTVAAPADQEKALLLLERQVKKLVRLVDDLLDFSRLSTGKITLRKERVDLRVVVQRGVETSRPVIDGHKHQFHLEIPEQPLWLEADPTRLEQVVVNLLANAAKYTPAGGVLGLRLCREDNQAVLGVRDTSIGIAPEMLPRIFDLFTQAEQGLDRAEGGLGVGLALVKALAEMHEGSVEARSRGLDQGSEFLVRLPVEEAYGGQRTLSAARLHNLPSQAIPKGTS